MEFANSPSLPDAHQQMRLGDLQASTQKWTVAIEFYLRAIECFKAIQGTLRDDSLIGIIEAQIVQCEKTIHFYRLKDRSEQAIKAERCSKINRAHSISNIKPSPKINRPMTRHNTIQLQNTELLGVRDGTDSLAALIFPNNKNKIVSPMMAKKTKDELQKMEELQTSNEALKNHLKAAFDDIERLKSENIALRTRTEVTSSSQQVEFGLLSTNNEDEEDSENELENTI